jgi:hypothetical protein
MNLAEERIKAINQKISLLNPEPEWNKNYLILKGIKGYWDEYTWDEIIEMLKPELDWIIPIRSHVEFKKFYNLMSDLDKLKELVKC